MSPRLRGRSEAPLTPLGIRDEAIRVLRSSLLVAVNDLRNPVVVVTSPSAGEGKTTITAALATSLASSGQRTVLVDFDLRHADLHREMALAESPGASDVLRGDLPLDDALQFVELAGQRGLYFLPAGSPVENPTELLAASRTEPLLTGLARQADIVLIDSAPVLPVADTLVVGRLAAGALLVLQAGTTPLPAAQRARDLLIRNQVRILGAVVNRMNGQSSSDRYGFGYGPGTEPGD